MRSASTSLVRQQLLDALLLPPAPPEGESAVIMRPTLLIEADEAVRTAVRLRHRHVLVDEYQDERRQPYRN